MKVFKKPIAVKFQYLTETITVQTLEGPVTAGPDQVLMTGVRGEQYPIGKKMFYDTYHADEGLGVAYKKKVIVDAEQIHKPTSVPVSWSGEPLTGKPGDYLVTYGPGDQAIVEESIFNETYEIVEE